MSLLVDFEVAYKQAMCPFDFLFSWLTHSGAFCLLEQLAYWNLGESYLWVAVSL